METASLEETPDFNALAPFHFSDSLLPIAVIVGTRLEAELHFDSIEKCKQGWYSWRFWHPVSLGRAIETALSPPSTVPQPSFCIFEVAFCVLPVGLCQFSCEVSRLVLIYFICSGVSEGRVWRSCQMTSCVLKSRLRAQ